MLFLLFQVGPDRYAIEATRVVEVVPLLELQPLLQASRGVAGLFNYRGRPVPAVDLAAITLGRPASDLLSTRIIVLNYPDDSGAQRRIGVIAEHATGLLRAETSDFMDPGLKRGASPPLGPMLMDRKGPIQWVQEQRWLPHEVSVPLLSEFAAKDHQWSE